MTDLNATPRCDEHEQRIDDNSGPESWSEAYTETLDFARKLERQLNAVAEALKLSHDHMRLYLSHYTPNHNVFDAVDEALRQLEEK